MQVRTFTKGASLVLALGLLAWGCSDDNGTNPPPNGGNGNGEENVITGSDCCASGVTLNLTAGETYTLRGSVVVEDGGTLNIPAGTLILGDADVQPTSLIVRIGGTLNATGTANNPVVFTSSRHETNPARGDWGGVVLNGESQCNFNSLPGEECIGEGNSGPYGGDVLDDDSGTLSYVRIEYAGYEVSLGNELNGLTMNGVGSGTQIDHIQAHFGLDDGIEWFGGTVSANYLVVSGASDDSFDYSTGWAGMGQFWVAQQDPGDADNGFEIDGNEEDGDATPFTDPQICNVTLIGGGPGSAGGESTNGILFRRGTAGTVRNVIIEGFNVGLDIDNSPTEDRVNLTHSTIWSSRTGDFADDDDGIDEEAWFTDAARSNRQVDPDLADAFNRIDPDFRPNAGSAALTGAFDCTATDPFFAATPYLGAFDPDAAQWIDGWTKEDWSQ